MRNIRGYVACLVENVSPWSSFFGLGIKNLRSALAKHWSSFLETQLYFKLCSLFNFGEFALETMI